MTDLWLPSFMCLVFLFTIPAMDIVMNSKCATSLSLKWNCRPKDGPDLQSFVP
uniref:Interleukin 17 receptor A n=1 Tax=Bursaphelenchus xylophilus TaxID=6326 RepID=A0A1I7SN41_BURXY